MNKQSFEKFYLVGNKIRTSNHPGKAEHDIPLLWQRFMEADTASRVPNQVEQGIYCAYTEYESDWTGEYSCFLGCKVSSIQDLPEGLEILEVPAGTYAIKSIDGPASGLNVIHAWKEIWASDLDRKYTVDFEHYEESSDCPGQQKATIYIALKD